MRMQLATWYLIRSLRDLMEEAGVDDEEVADRLGYRPQTITNWLKGVGQPSVGDIREFYTQFGDPEDREMLYMQQVVRAKKADQHDLETESRFSVLMMAKAWRHFGDIFMWRSSHLTGFLQTAAYHFKLLRPLEGTSDSDAAFGWEFKESQLADINARTDNYRMRILLADSVLLWLHEMSAHDRAEQLDLLREFNGRPGWEIRVMTRLHTLGMDFTMFKPAGSKTAGPAYAYTEDRERSWCYAEPERRKLYEKPVEPNWQRAATLEDFLAEHRDRLA